MDAEQQDDPQTVNGASLAGQPIVTPDPSATPPAKKRPRGRPWAKGVSGNPRGRPRTRQPAPTALRAGGVRTVFLSERLLFSYLGRGRGTYLLNLPSGRKRVIACEVDHRRGGLVLTLSSDEFRDVPAGSPIPPMDTHWSIGSG
jgi:hypothetical protein